MSSVIFCNNCIFIKFSLTYISHCVIIVGAFRRKGIYKKIIHVKNNYEEITIRMKIYKGEIPVCRIGKRAIRIRKDVIDAIIKTGSYTAKEKN